MPTKTISLRIDAYERLRRAKRPEESFSDVVLRARWDEDTVTGEELLRIYEVEGPFLSREALDRVEKAMGADAPPVDKWRKD